MAAILNSVDDRRQEMSGDIGSVISKSSLVENVGVEVEIASLSQAVQKLLPLPFFRPPSWISGGRRRRIFPGMAPLKSPYPKMGGRHRIRVSSWSVGEVRGGGCKFAPPRCSRYKIGPAVRGLSSHPFALLEVNDKSGV